MILGMFGARRKISAYFNNRAGQPDAATQKLLDKHRAELLGATSHSTKYGFFQAAWRLSRPYFLESKMSERALALTLLLTSIGLTYYQVTEVAVGFNEWNRAAGDFIQSSYNAVAEGQDKVREAWDGFKGLVGDLGVLTAKLLVVGYTNYKVTQHFALRWRNHMTDYFEKKWLDCKSFYFMQQGETPIDNPDQRIQEDPRKVADFAVGIITDAFDAVLSLATFSTILWNLSNDFNMAVFGGPDVVIPKFMFCLVMGYAAIGTAVTYYASKPLEKVAQDQEKFEGYYRSDVKELHEKAESIALNDAEGVQRSIMRKSFDDIYNNTKKIINIKSNLLVIRVLYHRLAGVVPLLVTFPDVVAGKMQMGGIFQVSGAFGEVKNAMSWYVNEAPRLREGKAYMNRMVEFDDSLNDARSRYMAMKDDLQKMGGP